MFLADKYTCPILGLLFWISGDISTRLQSQSVLPYSHCGGEHNVCSLHTPADNFDGQLATSPVPHLLLLEVMLARLETITRVLASDRATTDYCSLYSRCYQFLQLKGYSGSSKTQILLATIRTW